jgi:integrase
VVSVQRYTTASGAVRYRARVKSHGLAVASKVFSRKADAVAWEQDQYRRLRSGEWLDPRRGRVPLEVVAEAWLASRATVKRRTFESDRGVWRNYIAPRWRSRPVVSITTADTNWKRSVGWREAIAAIGRPELRVHDLRHTAASVWLGSGADPKVVQRVLGHASAAMTMDLYGHLIDQNLWAAAARLGDISGTHEGDGDSSADGADLKGGAG